MVKHGILHVHSMFSLHDSSQSPQEIVEKAKELGCKNITLTDHGTLLGIDDFMDAGKEYGINTIPGVEMYLEDRMHLVLFAKNYKGFQAISKALKEANRNQYIRKTKGTSFVYPILNKEALELLKGNKDVVVTSACIQGPVAVSLLQNYYIQKQIKKIEKKAENYRSLYESYMNTKEKYTIIVDEISKLKKERTAFLKYTKDPYLRQIERKQEQLKKIDLDLKIFDGDEKKQKKIHELETKQQALTQEIQQRKSTRQNAFEVVTYNDKKIEHLENKKKKLKEVFSKAESGKKKFEKYKKALDEYSLFDEKRLFEKAKDTARYLKEIFPCFYLELQYHRLEQERIVMPQLVRIGRELDIPLIAANDAHMKDNTEDSLTARQILRYNYFAKHQNLEETDYELYLKTDEELSDILSEILDVQVIQEAMENLSILEECNVKFPEEKHYPKCASDDFDELLKEARIQKIQQGKWNEIYENRLSHEISVIKKMGYVDYHMVVRDFCNAARKLGVVPKEELINMPVNYNKALQWIKSKGFSCGVGVGPGRGSAAGSLVCYLLGITNIDPIQNNLLFERFLNPERVTMPDIDTDIKTSLRPYVIRYTKESHGENAVSSIATTNTYAAKAAIQMVGRDRADELYGHLPKKEAKEKIQKYNLMVRRISDLVSEQNGTLSKSENVFKKEFTGNDEASIIWNRAKLIEGKVRGIGIHAGGVVISDNDDINEYVPLLWNESKQVWATQCDMVRVEKKGMLKFDILGLNTEDCISDCLYLILRDYGVSIDIESIPFEKEVFEEIYAKGKTNSVFQVESVGMKNMLMEFHPTCFEDIVLLIAMYRPGPMQFIPNIMDVKHKRKPLTYKTPMLEEILKSTYGAIAYQEQVMEIFQKLAGYSLGQADLVRRAMSKKKEEKLLIERKSFIYGDVNRNIKGCLKNGIAEDIANSLFDELMDFAKYAFNKSHAVAYATVSYQTAWLKYHYPKEFLCAMFNNKESEDFEPIIEDCMTYNIEVLPPDINRSFYDFSIEEDKIRFGIRGIKGIASSETIQSITNERNDSHSVRMFQDFDDFLFRCLETDEDKCKLFDKDIMEALIKSGCFDDIEKDRVFLYEYYLGIPFNKGLPACKNYARSIERPTFTVPNIKVCRMWEREYLKYYLRDNPLKEYRDDFYYGCTPINDLKDGNVYIFGMLTSYENKISKNGNKMLILNIQGKSGKITVLFLKDKCERYENCMEEYDNKVIRIRGTCKDGTIFGTTIERLSVNRTSYYYICDSKEKYTILLSELPQNEGLEELNIFTFWSGNVGNVHEIETPLLVRKKVTKSLVKKIGAAKEKE